MTDQSQDWLLKEWSTDPMVGDTSLVREDRLCRAIILENRRAIARGHGFASHAEYLADLNKRLDEIYPPNTPKTATNQANQTA